MQQQTRRTVWFCVAAWIMLLLAGCAFPVSDLRSTAAMGDTTIVFGATISITGKTAKEGEYTRDGYQMFIDTVNQQGGITVDGRSYKVALRYYDDESQPERAAQLYEKLVVEDEVHFLLGPYGSRPTAAGAPIAERYGVPFIAANGSADSIYVPENEFVFSVQTPAKQYLHGVIDAVRAVDPAVRTIAILYKDDPFSREVAQGVEEYAAQHGLEIVYAHMYPLNALDISAPMAELKTKNPDLLLGAGHLQDSLLIAKQAEILGVLPRAMGFSVGPSSPEFRANLQSSADYVLGSTQWTSALQYVGDDFWGTPGAFTEAFKQRYPHYTSVPYHVAESAAALLVYQRAIEQAGTLERIAVRDALIDLELMTFFGPIAFDERGVNSGKPMAVEQLQPDGRKYTVFPFEVAEQAMLYPMPAWDAR